MKRILIKLSGEQFGGVSGAGLDTDVIEALAKDIKESIEKHKCEVAVVVGGGNFVRGAELHKRAKIIHESTGHYMGMLAITMNSMALRDIFLHVGQKATILTKLDVPKVAESFTRNKAIDLINEGQVVIIAGGNGVPYGTTDSTAIVTGLELSCDAVIKVTKVDGVYDKDPKKNADAKKYTTLTYAQVFANENIKVMDRAAMAMASENNLKVMVCELKPGMITNILSDNFDGTIIQ